MGQMATCCSVGNAKASAAHKPGDPHFDERAICVCGNKFMDDSQFCRKCGAKRPGAHEEGVSPEVRLVAWMRRRNGVDCDFGAVFEELFGSRDPVNVRVFDQVLKEKGYHFDAKAAFSRIDRHAKCGQVGASDFETFQAEIEDREVEGLKHLRDFLKANFNSPAAAFKELGKGEGDELTQAEFIAAMKRLGFTSEDPEKVFRFIDKDYSGEVSFAEFKSVLKTAGKKNHHHHHDDKGGHHSKGHNKIDEGHKGHKKH